MTEFSIPWCGATGSFTFDAPAVVQGAPYTAPAVVQGAPYFLEVVSARLDSDVKLDFEIKDAATARLLIGGELPAFEDDMGTTTKRLFRISPDFTSGRMEISVAVQSGEDDGLYISPFLVVRPKQEFVPQTPVPTPVPTPEATPAPSHESSGAPPAVMWSSL